jgi:hypothetical protein
MALANKLSKSHRCQVLVTHEMSGYHIYLPCPECLRTHGRNELRDPKFAINVSKYLALGDDFRDLKERTSSRGGFNPGAAADNADSAEIRDTKSGICMRTRQSRDPHRFSVSELKTMSSITERHPDIATSAKVVGGLGSADREEHWEKDPTSGKMCPPPPGELIPITELPHDHPGVEYLLARGFNLGKLYDQFRCSWCVKEYPYGQNGIFYRKMPGGWKDTSQHRIIFHSLRGGVPLTWQARYPERISEDGKEKYALNPYADPFEWDHVATRANASAAWIPVPPFDEVDERGTLRFQPSKYRTAKYSSREMIGWDAAMKRAQEDPQDIKWVVLCEGPLDAARVGPGGVGLIGSSISPENAALVAYNFDIVYTAFDVDKAGRDATERITVYQSSNHFPFRATDMPSCRMVAPTEAVPFSPRRDRSALARRSAPSPLFPSRGISNKSSMAHRQAALPIRCSRSHGFRPRAEARVGTAIRPASASGNPAHP